MGWRKCVLRTTVVPQPFPQCHYHFIQIFLNLEPLFLFNISVYVLSDLIIFCCGQSWIYPQSTFYARQDIVVLISCRLTIGRPLRYSNNCQSILGNPAFFFYPSNIDEIVEALPSLYTSCLLGIAQSLPRKKKQERGILQHYLPPVNAPTVV